MNWKSFLTAKREVITISITTRDEKECTNPKDSKIKTATSIVLTQGETAASIPRKPHIKKRHKMVLTAA